MNQRSHTHWGSFVKKKGWDGLNNAAINTFNSNLVNSFVREIFQNSNDARLDAEDGNKQTLKIEIDYQSIERNIFPKYESLLEILKTMADHPANNQHTQFFKQALQSFSENRIGVFVYKDFNTSGLSGADDHPNSTFNACVLSEGQSIKEDEDSIGSYGIGKNSIFGLSKIRTIIYSSYNEVDGPIIQGVSKLASYELGGATYESRIYFGHGEKLNSLRTDTIDGLTPAQRNFFERKEAGLTQFAVCPILIEEWEQEFTKAILKNYWLLLHDKQLEVVIKYEGETLQLISASTLDELMKKYFDPDQYMPDDLEPRGNPFDYYQCYVNSDPIEENVHMLGKMKFYFCELDHKKTNHILYVRNGMVIYGAPIWGFGSIGYCGIVRCDNREGNILLKMMEPPEHNRFDPSRLDSKHETFNQKDGNRAVEEINRIIRTHLNEILNKYRKQAEDIPWLNNLLGSIKGSEGSGTGHRTGNKSEIETLERINSDTESILSFSSSQKNSLVSDTEGEESGLGGVKPSGPGPKPPRPPRPGPDDGSVPMTKKAKKVRTRIFRQNYNSETAIYKIIISADEDLKNRRFKISQVGDSGTAACFEIINVIDEKDSAICFNGLFNKQNELIGFQLNDIIIPNVLTMTITEPYKSTFKIEEI